MPQSKAVLRTALQTMRDILPFRGWAGLGLIAVAWPLNWSLEGVRTHLLFFPLWLGYTLLVDGIVLRRTGSSILDRSRIGFTLLFLVSSVVWWIFELINLRTANWKYVGRDLFSDVEYALLASLSFSVVIPAVLETADLFRSMRWANVSGRQPVPVTPRLLGVWIMIGAFTLILMLVFPRVAYPLAWISLVFLIEPLAYRLRDVSLLHHLERGDWTPFVILPLGALTCGFFWELWNYWSFPKWIYDTPGFNFLHVFEMPLFGYLGYLPFGLELYPMTHLLMGRSASQTIGWTDRFGAPDDSRESA